MERAVILGKLKQIEHEIGGYIIYIFENLENISSPYHHYVSCVRFPNWNHRAIEIDEEGYLEFVEIIAGEDKWFDGKEFNCYNYDNIQFLRFIAKPKEEDTREIIVD